jgi:hypothetical protein
MIDDSGVPEARKDAAKASFKYTGAWRWASPLAIGKHTRTWLPRNRCVFLLNGMIDVLGVPEAREDAGKA